MGTNTAIEWAQHSFNPWHGCQKVTPGCKFCYAERLDGEELWLPRAPRRIAKDDYWLNLKSWNKAASKAGAPATVFVGSMCDVFDPRAELNQVRQTLWAHMELFNNLIFLLLTKRPQYIAEQIPRTWLLEGFPLNVWLGVSVEQQEFTHRIRKISDFRVKRFVSFEPLLGYIDCEYWQYIDWAIIGGESGKGCRPMELDWALHLVAQSRKKGVPVFVKQLGGYPNQRSCTEGVELWPPGLQYQERPFLLRAIEQTRMEGL